MKTIDELLIAWRDGSITSEESKELERLLGEPGGRERLFDEFMATATITEALKVDAAAPKVQRDVQGPPSWWRAVRVPVAAAAAVMLLAAGAIYFRATTPRGFEIVAGAALVDQKENGAIREQSIVESAGNSPVTIRFPDGSTMVLAPSGSSVLHQRSVDLKAGKASFEIPKAQTAETFSVRSETGSVTAFDAKFSVELKPKEQATQGGAEMKSTAMVMLVSVLVGSVNVDFNGSRYVLKIGESQAFGAEPEKMAMPPLPEALKAFSGTLAGGVVSVNKDFIVLKLSIPKEGFKDKEVAVVVKDVKDLPELAVGDLIYTEVKQVDDHLVATKVLKAKAKKKDAPSGDF